MITAITIDDEVRGLNMLNHLLEKHKEIQNIGAFTDSEQAISKIDELRPDLVILDINMPKYDGFAVLERVKHKNFKCIFVTAHDEFAVKAFHYSAIDYVLKPVEESIFHNAVDKALSQINKVDFTSSMQTLLHNISQKSIPTNMKICIPNINGFSLVDTNDIVCCEADSCYTIFKLTNGTQIVASKTLQEYENILINHDFVRVHRSYIINVNHIKSYQKGQGGVVTMSNGSAIEVSRRKKDEFLSRIELVYKG
jgi:two-component system, LytTR family, response regulator